MKLLKKIFTLERQNQQVCEVPVAKLLVKDLMNDLEKSPSRLNEATEIMHKKKDMLPQYGIDSQIFIGGGGGSVGGGSGGLASGTSWQNALSFSQAAAQSAQSNLTATAARVFTSASTGFISQSDINQMRSSL